MTKPKRWQRAFFISHLALLGILCLPHLSLGQSGTDSTGTGGQNRITGRIYFPSGRRADTTIKVTLESSSSERLSVMADASGAFTFNYIAGGSYTITVDAGELFDLARESLTVENAPSTGRNISSAELIRTGGSRPIQVPIYLQLKRPKDAEYKPGVVNAALSNIPTTAQAAYQRAEVAIRAGNTIKAIEELKAALAAYPDFPLALNELGAQYINLKQFDAAAETLSKAVALDPENTTIRLNYGKALVGKKSHTEAALQLRQALQKDDSSWVGHLYLGLALIGLRQYDEAEKELLRSLDLSNIALSLPHYYLGAIYWQKGQNKKAADEFETYLKMSPKVPDAERLRGVIKDLRSKT